LPRPGYEVRDASVRDVVAFLIGLIALIVVVQLGLWGMLEAIRGQKPESATQLTAPEVISDQRRKLVDRETATLEGYGWVDRKSGAVQIPISRAIDLVAEQGLPPTTSPRRTEIEVNSHSGTAEKQGKGQEKDKEQEKDKGRKPPDAGKRQNERNPGAAGVESKQ
jgi:hypothetical protein